MRESFTDGRCSKPQAGEEGFLDAFYFKWRKNQNDGMVVEGLADDTIYRDTGSLASYRWIPVYDRSR